jgi:hypothetical protein
MYANPNAILIFIVYNFDNDEFRLIEQSKPIASKLGEDDCLVDSFDFNKSESFITTIRLQYGANCKIKICAGEYGEYGCILYFEVTDYARNRKLTVIN